MSKIEIMGEIISTKQLTEDIFDVWIRAKEIADQAKAGQFVSFYTDDPSKMLPRPISICEIDKKAGSLRFTYRVTGEKTGTKEFSLKQVGDKIRLLGPLGNGFPLEEGEKAILIGGGIGIPPMLELAKERTGENIIIAGYRDELYLEKDLKKQGELYIATDSGSFGVKGTVIDAIKENELKAAVIYACGPTPMLKAVKEYAKTHNITKCYLSMEEKMACGIGACLACVCKSKEKDEHSQVHNKRVCKEGPVFLAWEVEL
ncbi:MAG TPA: dihydroorotate dehydrogenase electron transfer subunit [Candidatus Dorea intestinavium]|nr:dihydroorotate dehydrogenase electron transfer subunit [Candidatus Dorea intestinavium]